MRALIYFLLALGSTLVLAAFFLSGGSILRSFWALILSGKILESWLIVVALFSAIIHWVRYSTKEWRGDRNIQHNYRSESDVVATLTPQLNGEFTPYVIEAAEALGELRDRTAVPALLKVLNECIERQRPNWREVSIVIVGALEKIGDRRALPLLRRIENVRGIGLISVIRQAIAAIEPHSSLLRPYSFGDSHQTLLRPAKENLRENQSSLLVRAVEIENDIKNPAYVESFLIEEQKNVTQVGHIS